VPPAEAGSVITRAVSARLKSCPDTEQDLTGCGKAPHRLALKGHGFQPCHAGLENRLGEAAFRPTSRSLSSFSAAWKAVLHPPYGAKYPEISRISCVVPCAKASLLPLVLGTMAMFDVIAPSLAFSVETVGCGEPSGHSVRK
jgi:hypothetical protein